jgi:hypothetical protein
MTRVLSSVPVEQPRFGRILQAGEKQALHQQANYWFGPPEDKNLVAVVSIEKKRRPFADFLGKLSMAWDLIRLRRQFRVELASGQPVTLDIQILNVPEEVQHAKHFGEVFERFSHHNSPRTLAEAEQRNSANFKDEEKGVYISTEKKGDRIIIEMTKPLGNGTLLQRVIKRKTAIPEVTETQKEARQDAILALALHEMCRNAGIITEEVPGRYFNSRDYLTSGGYRITHWADASKETSLRIGNEAFHIVLDHGYDRPRISYVPESGEERAFVSFNTELIQMALGLAAHLGIDFENVDAAKPASAESGCSPESTQ